MPGKKSKRIISPVVDKGTETTSLIIGVKSPTVSNGGVVKPKNKTAKTRTEKALGQFLSDVLPALKKEMSHRKKEQFSWEAYAAYFKPDSKYLATFILPLFKFLEKDSIVCSRYGNFDNRHMVKTSAGFDRVMLLSRHCDTEELTPDVQQYLSQRYGREWFKIPSKDGFRAKAASASGFEGCFKVSLVGMFEDSFIDKTTGATIYTINPSLMYEPLRPPPPKKERKVKKQASKEKEEESDEEDEDNGDVDEPSPNDYKNVVKAMEPGAQEVPIDFLEE